MVIRREIDEIRTFSSPRYLTTSLLLEVDARKYPRTEYLTIFKNLVKQKHQLIIDPLTDREQQRSVEADLRQIEDYLLHRFDRSGWRGLALFSCAAEGFFRAVPLPVAPRDRLAVEPTPYCRPLLALAEASRRLCVALVDRRRARILESFLGRIRTVEDLEYDVPKRVISGGGRRSYESKGIDRHVKYHEHLMYQEAAERLLAVFRREAFDLLVTGGPIDDVLSFEAHLHPFLQDRLAGRLAVDIHTSRVGLEAPLSALQQELALKETATRLGKLFEQAGRGRLGVLGLEATLTVLRRGQVHSLFVQDGFETPGRICLECRFIGVEQAECPTCRQSTAPVEDIVDEMLDEAMRESCFVYAVPKGNSDFERAGSVGALLRFAD